MEEYLSIIFDEWIGRRSGPLHFRFLLQRVVATLLAIRAGRNDARRGNPIFFQVILWQPRDRPHLLREAWRDVGTLFLAGVGLDICYQWSGSDRIRLGASLTVATVLVILPYVVLRSFSNR